MLTTQIAPRADAPGTPPAVPTGHVKDKTSWPALAPLPADLPAAASTHAAKYFVGTRFTSGSYADGPFGESLRITPSPEGTANGPALLAGHDPRAALAAAAAMATQAFTSPDSQDHSGTAARTLVGVFQSRAGAMMVAPLWFSPGSNDWAPYRAVGGDLATTPQARFRFTDETLAAVVSGDGWIVNPAKAAIFAAHA